MSIDAEIRDLGSDTWPRLLWHYCPASAFHGIIDSRMIRLSEACWMNDPAELRWGRQMMVRTLLDDFPRAYVERSIVPFESSEGRWPHIACFSDCKDSLSQWRAYAENGTGYAIGINPRHFGLIRNFPQRLFIPTGKGPTQQVTSDCGAFWFPMVYDWPGQRKAARAIRDRFVAACASSGDGREPEAKLQVDSFAMTMAFKPPHYQDEREYRIAYGHLPLSSGFRGAESLGPASTYDGHGRQVVYTPLLLKPGRDGKGRLVAVRLGPRCPVSAEDTRDLLRFHGFDDVLVQRSKAPYR